MSSPALQLTSGDRARGAPHIVLLPSAGMGHLVPFTRLALALSTGHGCDVSLVTALPTVSAAESHHLAALFACSFPALRWLDLSLAKFDALTSSEFPCADPFYVRYEALRRAAPVLLGPVLAGARASALVADIALASVAIPVAKELRVPCYVFFTASATMLAFKAYFPSYLDSNGGGHSVGDIDVPGVYRVPRSSVPQALHDPDNIFTQQFVANGRALTEADGLLVNAFDTMEPEAVAALWDGSVVAHLPPVFAVGLFVSHCGWNSVTEAVRCGVPVLAWPRFADQRVNARVVARCGAGVWTERWSWEGEEAVVTAEEITKKVKAAMADDTVAETATRVRMAAVRATADGGTSQRSLAEFVRRCREGTVGNAP